MQTVFHYLDYRHYLRDYYQEQKQKRGSTFSFRTFARAAALSSPNFLKLVMEGKRNLGADGIRKFSKALRLGKEETNYFQHLVHFNQAVTDDERNEWYAKLRTSKKYQEVKEIEQNTFVYYSRWYYAAVRELVLLPDFRENTDWIARKLSPPITRQEAATALELLKALKFVKYNKQRRLIQSERNIATAREVLSLAISNFHRQMIRQAGESLDKTQSGKRDISSLTVAVSQKKFEEAKRRIQEFRRELNILLSDEDKPTAVYQINFQIFNLSEVPW